MGIPTTFSQWLLLQAQDDERDDIVKDLAEDFASDLRDRKRRGRPVYASISELRRHISRIDRGGALEALEEAVLEYREARRPLEVKVGALSARARQSA